MGYRDVHASKSLSLVILERSVSFDWYSIDPAVIVVEVICEEGCETPTINYSKYNGNKYKVRCFHFNAEIEKKHDYFRNLQINFS